MATFSRETIQIPSIEPGVSLDVWFYKPAGEGPFPVVVAGHGMTLTKDAGLAVFGERWAAGAGYASLIFDYRNFGKSGGEPRNLVDLPSQLDDFRSAIAWARHRAETFRNDKIVVMGSAIGGLNVAALALEDTGLAGVMAHSPLLDGYATLTAAPANPRLLFWAVVDWVKGQLGLSPVFIKAIGRPGEFAFLNTPSSYAGFEQMFEFSHEETKTPFSRQPNVLAPRLAFQIMGSRPGTRLSEAACPVLLVTAQQDDMIPVSLTRDLALKAGERIKLVEVDGGHFDVMEGGKGFEANIGAQLEFLRGLL